LRFYLSDIHSAWPFSRQEAAFDAAIPGWRDMAVYRDTLRRGQRKSKSVAALHERAILLRPTSRPRADTEEIYIAAWPVLAWSPRDLVKVLGALSQRGEILIDLDTGIRILPTATPQDVAKACAAFELACNRFGDYGRSGGHVSGQRRAEVAKSGCERIRERWGLPSSDYPTAALLAEANVSRPTAIAYLGRREEAQRNHEKSRPTADRNRRRKQP
jgi:hypothetical protein